LFLLFANMVYSEMRPSAQDLGHFYSSNKQSVVAEIQKVLEPWAACLPPKAVLAGMGYPVPYQSILGHKRSSVWILPASQGGVPGGCLAHETLLPLADQSLDAAFLIHYLEFCSAKEALQELWRVLVPEGALLAVVPNQYSPASHLGRTPFAQGITFSASKMRFLLEEAGFTVHHCTPLLFLSWRSLRIFPGVLALHACKRLYRPVPSEGIPLPTPVPSCI
jgi:hypothetical protein